MNNPTPLWTYAQIADLTGISAATLRVWRLRGKLPAPDYEIGPWPAWKPTTIESWWGAKEPETEPEREPAQAGQ